MNSNQLVKLYSEYWKLVKAAALLIVNLNRVKVLQLNSVTCYMYILYSQPTVSNTNLEGSPCTFEPLMIFAARCLSKGVSALATTNQFESALGWVHTGRSVFTN